MAQLYLHDREINTVFDLRGDRENDITFSLGWALAQSDIFLARFLRDIFPQRNTGKATSVHLQRHDENKNGGYTDIEIKTEVAHVIVEAKRGWNLPKRAQLKKYAQRFGKSGENAIVVMAEREPTGVQLPKRVSSVPIQYRSWKQITKTALQSVGSGSNAEKRLLREFAAYMKGLMQMQHQESNLVYVIALGSREKQTWSGMAWRDHVINNSAFHKDCREKWPSTPPNYLGFRYDGQLQSIHHVESYAVITDLTKYVPVRHKTHWMYKRRHFCKLGPAIVPKHTVKTTGLWNTKVWAALDLLLTCKTVSGARDKTTERLAALAK